jgi:putative nucleotidyltransferase with HDIG domain
MGQFSLIDRTVAAPAGVAGALTRLLAGGPIVSARTTLLAASLAAPLVTGSGIAHHRRTAARSVDVVPLLVELVARKDRATAHHSARVAFFAGVLAGELGWSPADQAIARTAGLLHDLGKVRLPDRVLLGGGRLSQSDWDLVRRHPDWGADVLAERGMDHELVAGVRAHHERWDGSGYPGRLRAREIPVLGRLLAICDSYEAMTATRPYSPAKPPAAARAELDDQAGRLYDPDMTRAFLAALERPHAKRQSAAPRWRRAAVHAIPAAA